MFNNYRTKDWVRNKCLKKNYIQYLETETVIIYIYKSMSYLNVILDIEYEITIELQERLKVLSGEIAQRDKEFENMKERLRNIEDGVSRSITWQVRVSKKQ